ncbi:unnamed protein product, partial [Allacma fusca]
MLCNVPAFVPILWFTTTFLLAQTFGTASFFQRGKEYVYLYRTTVSVGSNDYIHFASVFNISGEVHFLLRGNDLSVQLSSIRYGVYNGEYNDNDPSLNQQIESKAYEQLNALMEPFVITLDNGKIRNLTLSVNTPEWARNIQRGLANTLQLDLAAITVNTAESLTVDEETILGNCRTDYTVIPASKVDGLRKTQVRKFRSHVNCPDFPIQTFINGNLGYCPDLNARNVLNSSVWASYELDLVNNVLTAREIKQGSTTQYQPFGDRGQLQYSFALTSLILDHIIDGGNVSIPTNSVNVDLKFVFDNPLTEDEDLTEPPPNIHLPPVYASHIPDAQGVAMGKLQTHLNELADSLPELSVFTDEFKLVTTDPLAGVSLMEILNYQQLTQVYEELKSEFNSRKIKFFLDLLAFCGTGPSSLLVRDIARDTRDPYTITRLLVDFASRVRNPTEKLAQEFESIVIKTPSTALEKINGRLLDLAYASILNRACKKSGCKTTGLIDRYVKFYSDRFDSTQDFQEKTAAVLALRNIGNNAAAEKLLDIFIEKHEERSVRAQALQGVKSLTKDPNIINKNILRVFYDRSEHSELRNLAVDFSLMHGFSPELLNQVVIYMWTEKCPLVKNYVYSLVNGIGSSTLPCLQERAAYARASLKYFPPWTPASRYSAVYINDYYDRDFSFGKMTVLSVQQDGQAALQATIFFNIKGIVSGYEVTYSTIFVRLEGLSRTLMNFVIASATQARDFTDIKNIFVKIGIVERTALPLKIELAVMVHKRFVAYIAVDDRAVAGLQGFMAKVLQSLLVPSETNVVRTSQIASVLIERPNEFGIPVTIRSKVSNFFAFEAKTLPEKIDGGFRQDQYARLQSHTFGETTLSNHFPALAMTHSVAAYRAFRFRIPRNFHFSLDTKEGIFNFSLSIPKQDDPVLAVAGAATYTSYYRDGHLRFVAAVPGIGTSATKVSKGRKFSRNIKLLDVQKNLPGFNVGTEFLQCEKFRSRLDAVGQLGISGPENKNSRGLISQLNLGFSNLLDLLFLSPKTPPCTFKAYLHQDNNQSTTLERIEGQIHLNPPNNNTSTTPGQESFIQSTLKLVYEESSLTKSFYLDYSSTKLLHEEGIKIKLVVEDEILNKTSIICADVIKESSTSTSLLGSNSDDEPRESVTFKLVYTPDSNNGRNGTCVETATSTTVKYQRESHLSHDQVEEFNASNKWPYRNCNDDRQFRFPGPYNPPTSSCYRAALEQSVLRESNTTIDYGLGPEVQKSCQGLLKIISIILLPFQDTEAADVSAEVNDITKQGSVMQGRIKINANFNQDFPTADVHWFEPQEQQIHYHNIDLSAYPFSSPRSRLPSLSSDYLDLGLMGKCVVSSRAVETFDNSTAVADLPECETLVSGDCVARPYFAVFAKKTGPETIAVKLLM